MRQMMQGVVLHGTGRKAILQGYTSAGKTGTAQKIDPATRTYSRTKYIASFAGFAPVNNPVLTCVVILDSPVGGHHGGEVGAPIFNRVVQQALEYLHTPHDVELPANRRLLLASIKVKQQDLEEGSPDRIGDPLDLAEVQDTGVTPAKPNAPGLPPTPVNAPVVNAALTQQEILPAQVPTQTAASQTPSTPQPQPSSGTVVLDIEEGGIVVPAFGGKSVRAAIELAEKSDIDLDIVGDGHAQMQSPLPGARVPKGSKVTVRFGR